MKLTLDLTPTDRACPDCGERVHKAVDAILTAELGKGLAKGGEVDAIGDIETLVSRTVDKRLRKLAKSLRP